MLKKTPLPFFAKIKAGDVLLKIDKEDINDVLDYRFFLTEEKLTLTVEQNGVVSEILIKKDEYEDLGLEFESYLMDKQRSCKNKCIFCFIDQNPKGMRESIYFKDDDDRLSFLFGNYITLTNLTDQDIDRILRMHISPVNISVHTTDPLLRVKMMKNPSSGSSLSRLFKLCEGGIKINTQMVLCPGFNDGEALEKTLADLDKYVPTIQSIACVPVGLTAYREGLEPLRPFTKEEAAKTIDTIEKWADIWEKRCGERVGYPSDEFFILAEREIPPAPYYGDFQNLENGVGLIASTKEEFYSALEYVEPLGAKRKISCVSGVAAAPYNAKLCRMAEQKDNTLTVQHFAVKNNFFGGHITVSGLVTGSDIITALKGQDLGDCLIIPDCMLRHENDLFLDNLTPYDIEQALNVKVKVISTDGASLAEALVEQEI